MHISLINAFVFSFLSLQLRDCTAKTTCEDSQKHFANLCFSPKPFTDIDYNWAQTNEPSNGWYSILGNDVTRLHLSEMLKGEILSTTENSFDGLCFKNKISVANEEKESFDGEYFGFDNLTSNYTCKYSADSPGLFLCDDFIPRPKYHGNFNYYVTYSDNKSIVLFIGCFPNGQVGWQTASINNTFTDEEKKIIDDKITSLGFSVENTVVLYDKDKCLEN